MLKLKEDIGKVDDNGDSWEKVNEEVEVVTDDKSQKLKKLTEIVMERFLIRLAMDSSTGTGNQKKMLINHKKCIKRCPKSGSQSCVEGSEKEDYLIKKQKKHTTSHNVMKQKQKKKKTDNASNKMKLNQRKGHELIITKFTKLDLEPPPDMPEAFRNRIIEGLHGTEIKLIIQKFVQVTDLRPSQNRFAMIISQVRNKFLSEAEEEKLNKKIAIDNVVFVEPRNEVSTLNLDKWKIGSSDAYVFKTQWSSVVTNNADCLKPMAVVQVWSFRKPNSELGFVLIKVKNGEDGHVIN